MLAFVWRRKKKRAVERVSSNRMDGWVDDVLRRYSGRQLRLGRGLYFARDYWLAHGLSFAQSLLPVRGFCLLAEIDRRRFRRGLPPGADGNWFLVRSRWAFVFRLLVFSVFCFLRILWERDGILDRLWPFDSPSKAVAGKIPFMR